MLHKETVEAGTLDLIKQLIADPKFENFFLVGGTALSLMIGHRKSLDIDLFTEKDFDAISLKQHLEQTYSMKKGRSLKNGVFGLINDIKVDIIGHPYPLIKPLQEIEGIRMASLEDIGAMKLHAIVQNGTRYKDFIDMFFLLEHKPLRFLIKTYEQKYPDINMQLAKNALVYFNDIDYSVPIELLKQPIEHKIIENRLRDAIVNTLSLYAPHAQKQAHRKRKGLGF